MDETRTPTPQEPKKSFWQKLFGGGKPASSPPPAQASEPQNTGDPASNTNPTPATDETATTVPPNSDWRSSPLPTTNEVPADKTVAVAADPEPVPSETWDTPPVPSPAAEPTPPVPSWRDTPAGVAEPLTEVPVPPSDPMVTPVTQQTEGSSYAQSVAPLAAADSTVSPANTSPEPTVVINNQTPQVADQDNQKVDDRPSITPPAR